jgi:hypothetical protein
MGRLFDEILSIARGAMCAAVGAAMNRKQHSGPSFDARRRPNVCATQCAELMPIH